MTLTEYQQAWAADAPIPKDALDETARNVPYLHAKWWKFYSTERLKYRKLEQDYKVLYKNKYEWYNGKMLDEDRVKLGWQPAHRKLLPAQIPTYIDADPDVQEVTKARILSEETLKFLEDVIRQINGRGYHIKNAIDFLKFSMGV